MQWDGSPNAGFTAGDAVAAARRTTTRGRNVAAQRDDPDSMLSLYRRLLALRRAEPALVAGAYSPAGAGDDWLAYLRHFADRRFLVVLNLGPEPVTVVPEAGRSRVVWCCPPTRTAMGRWSAGRSHSAGTRRW